MIQDTERDFEWYNRNIDNGNRKITCIATAQILSNSQMILKNIDPNFPNFVACLARVF